MPISPIAMPVPSSTLSELVAFLTRPLILVYPAPFVLQLQLILHTNLSAFFPGNTITSPFTFLLSPAYLPPTPIYAACLQSGVAWPEWIRALGGQPMYVFVMEGSIKVRVGEIGEAITVWASTNEETLNVPAISKTMARLPLGDDETESPMTIKLREMLESVRTRNRSAAASDSPIKPISLPTLLPTISVTSNPFDDDDLEVETEEYDPGFTSDTESDVGSTTSSRFSAFTTESLTSISSSSSSPISCSSELPIEFSFPTIYDKKPITTSPSPDRTPTKEIAVPIINVIDVDTETTPTKPLKTATDEPRVHFLERDQQSSPIPSRYLSRSQRRLARVTVDTTKTDFQRFTYEGGQTGVMTGGVMLGGVKPKSGAIPPAPPAAAAQRKGGRKNRRGARGHGGVAPVVVAGAAGEGKGKGKEPRGGPVLPGAFAHRKRSGTVMLGPETVDWRIRA